MPRTGKITPREIRPDPIYESRLLTKLVNSVMKQGKKSIAQKHVYSSLQIIKDKEHQEPLEIFETAVRNVTPQMEVRSRRVGGAAYQVPIPIKGKRGAALALRWLVQEARKRPNNQHHTFSEKLAAEIMDAARGEGMAFQKKITSHKMAEANKAFAHFRW
jgi:small subunit ribosomal protein S7